jgi:peptidoglycan/xylan/chitin deacetylase (PgdA/CDA1 family)
MHVNHRKKPGAALMALMVVVVLLSGCRSASANIPVPPEQTDQARTVPTGMRTSLPAATATLRAQKTATATSTPTPTAASTATLGPGMVSVTAGRLQAPILMYHRVSNKGGSRYTLPVESFRQQMQYLHDEGYQTLTVTQFADALRDGGAIPKKPVVLTFDDGYLDVYENAFPILKEMGFTATVYIITSTLEPSKSFGYLQEDQIKELFQAGWEIGSHSVTHSNLTKTKLGVGNELKESKAALDDLLDVPVTSFSYPYAVANAEIKELAAQSGYENAVGVDIFVTHPAKRLYYLSRREVDRAMPMFNFRKLLEPGKEEAEANALLTSTPDAP